MATCFKPGKAAGKIIDCIYINLLIFAGKRSYECH